MPLAPYEVVAHPAFVITELGPVAVVELLDDLKRPPPVQHVAANQFGLQPVGDVAVARLAQFVAGVAEEQVGVPHQLVKRVQVPAGALDELECFRHLANCGHGVVVVDCHPRQIPRGPSTQPNAASGDGLRGAVGA